MLYTYGGNADMCVLAVRDDELGLRTHHGRCLGMWHTLRVTWMFVELWFPRPCNAVSRLRMSGKLGQPMP
jgi:hypothetical protein